MQRRDFFSFLNSAQNKELKINPPYLSGDIDECLNCEAPCVSKCEEDILEYENSPFINFAKGGCTYCEACFHACTKDVLNSLDTKIQATIKLSTKSCIAWHSVVCNSCADVCSERAIKFFGMFKPTVDLHSCTACGMCIHVCPSNAISLSAK